MPSIPLTPSYTPDGVPVLWSDDHLLAVDKPAGLLAIRDGYDAEKPYLARLLAPRFGRVWVVHRLDKETSGVMLFARTAQAHRLLNAAFEHRQVRKTYHGLVAGIPPDEAFTIDQALRVDGDRRHRTMVDAMQGKPAVTEVRVIERYSGATLVSAHPLSGYTHQIRAHLAFTGFPLLCDTLYGEKLPVGSLPASEISRVIDRLALHARNMVLLHPFTHEILQIEAEYPADFRLALQVLRKGLA